VSATQLEWFGNAMREFGHSIGKRNIFTLGEIYDDEETIAHFVGRNSTEAGSFGIDSALDFPLFYQLPWIAKAIASKSSKPGVSSFIWWIAAAYHRRSSLQPLAGITEDHAAFRIATFMILSDRL
jgi:hypothetical protein